MADPFPDWFLGPMKSYWWQGTMWGLGFYGLTAAAVIAPVVAWLLSNSNITKGNNQPWYRLVGFWTAVATAATGLNASLAMGGRSESAWAAHTYLENATYQYQAKPDNRSDAYLADALTAASEIYNRARRPTDHSLDAARGRPVETK